MKNTLKNIRYYGLVGTLSLAYLSLTTTSYASVSGEVAEVLKNEDVKKLLRFPVIFVAVLMILAVSFIVVSVGLNVLKVSKAEDERSKYEAIDAFKSLTWKVGGCLGLILFLGILLNLTSFLTGAGVLKLIYDSFFSW